MQGNALQKIFITSYLLLITFQSPKDFLVKSEEVIGKILNAVALQKILITSYLLLINYQKILNAILGKSEEVRGNK